ncbi:MAG: DUF1844 domain-containing protein [Balneolaceae bacterium]
MNGENLNKDQQNQLLMMMLIQQHQQIAMIGMGKLKNPSTDSMDRDLSSAKYAIDTLSALNTYTKGNLPTELKGYLDQTLTTLRLNYADEVKKGDSKAEEKDASED